MRVTIKDLRNRGCSRDSGRLATVAKTRLTKRSAVGVVYLCCTTRSLPLHERVDTLCGIIQNYARYATANVTVAAVREGTCNRVDRT